MKGRNMDKFQTLCRSAIVICIWNGFSALGTVYHSNGSASNVQALHNSAQDGDTITLPAGTFFWATTVTITKGITLVGQTTTDPVHKTANDQTIVIVNTGANGNQPLLNVNSSPGKSYRVSGITFRTGRTGVMDGNGMIRLNGDSHAVRVDHCHFDDLAYEAVSISVWGPIYGVIDHNLFDNRTTNNQSININMASWGGRDHGDGSWAEPAYYGSEKFVFIEDNCFNNTNGHAGGWIDGYRGGRYVYRYNHVYDSAPTNHGTEIGRDRGLRCMEVYNNDFHWNSYHSSVGGTRSGGLITHDNVSYGTRPDRGATMGEFRNFANFTTSPWTQANGTNPWDSNDPQLYASGTAGTGTNSDTIVDRTKRWRANQWSGYTAKRLSDGKLALITSNTNNTLTVIYDAAHEGAVWASGDRYQIHKVLITLDQPCRGAGHLITGDNPINSTTGAPAWPHQALEPCYSWNDTYGPTGAHVNITQAVGAFAFLVEGRDFFNNTPMPGYTPYTYPHPLVTGAGPARTDFNNDGKPDYLLYNPTTQQTVIWYLNNNVLIGPAYGPTLWPGWNVAGVADFNLDGQPDYLLFRPSTGQTAIWYLNNNVFVGHSWGPTLWPGWSVAGVADFNLDGHPDWVLVNPSTGQTDIWYLNNNVRIGHSWGPRLWPGWNVAGVADFNLDGHPDWVLVNPSTGQTDIWYLNNNVFVGHSWGPRLWPGWNVAGVADFNLNGHPDYLLLNPSTRQTAIWYLNNNVFVGSALGPAAWAGWSLVAP